MNDFIHPRGRRILILEDEDAQRRTLADIIADEGFEPLACTSVDAALTLVGRQEICAAIVDQRLAGESGIAFLEHIRRVSPRPRVIMNTAYASLDSVRESLNLGAFAYVEKAGDPAELIGHVRRAVESWTEEALRESEQRLASLYRAANDGIFIVDPERQCFVDANPRGAAMLGYRPEQLTGMPIRSCHPNEMAELQAFIDRVLHDGTGTTEALTCTDAEGRVIPVEVSASSFKSGEATLLVKIVRDVSQRRTAEVALRESERRLRAIFEHSPATITLKETDGRYILVNRAYERYYGRSQAELAGRRTREAQPQRAADIEAHERATLEVGQSTAREYAFELEGEQRILHLVKFPVRDERGNISELGGIGTDITELKRIQQALAKSEERFQGLYDDAPDMYFTLARDGTVLSVNQFGADYLGYTKEALVGKAVWSVIHAEDRARVKAQIAEMLDGGRTEGELEFRKVRKDGSVLWVHERIRIQPHAEHGEPELRIVCRDSTEAHDLSEELTYQASHDPLTGLVNRRELEHRLQRILDTARTHDSEHALCYLDLDQFKVINDTCGHVAGDELLRQLGELLPDQVRKRDTLARLGGDEFGVLMEHCSLMQARRVANTLRKRIEEYRFIWEGKTFSIGVSIGLVPITAVSESVPDVLSAADTACYVAKDQGRNRIHVYHEDDEELVRRQGEMEWVSRINWALENERFQLYVQSIQPVGDGTRGTPRDAYPHFELLLRMRDEKDALTLPGAFLPAAERYNLSVRIDRWVVATAIGWLETTAALRGRPYLCCINLSGTSLADEAFLKFVITCLDEVSVPAEQICFEITETAAIANLTSATRFITALKAWGCKFALDDFGSGLSSFAYLKHLAVDFLKIDGVFVKDIASDPIDFAMVRSINEIGKVMGKQTIAEFVEDGSLIEKLREVGVDFAQGYALGRPEPLEVFERALEAGRDT